MMQTLSLGPGITLRCIPDRRFHQGCLSIQLVRPMVKQEAAMNALLPEVLLRGCRSYPDLRQITLRLDELYGTAVGSLVRRVGDYQTTGLYAGFLEDRFVTEPGGVFAPVAELMRELLLEPVLDNGVFREDYVSGEKQNLIDQIEARRNDKQAYAMNRLMSYVCREDSYGIPKLGEVEWVSEITPRSLYEHYRRVLSESQIDVFYVGSVPTETVAKRMKRIFEEIDRDYVNLPAQSPLFPAPCGEYREELEVSQGKLCMGFVVNRGKPDETVMQLLNLVLGGDMTGKLFTQIRERQSLCYAVGSSYYGCKGILTVSAGIDSAMEQPVREAVLRQVEDCRAGKISEAELHAAKQAMRASLLSVHDSPVSMEHYYAVNALSGWKLTPEEYIRAVEAVTAEQLAEAAHDLELHSVFFLKGVEA